MRRWALWACLALSGCLVDVTHDGVVVVACVGDSNTEAGYLPGETGWCEQLALPAGVVVRNYGERGAAWGYNWLGVDHSTCRSQTAQAIAEGADTIVAACGTNNVGVNSPGSWGAAATYAVLDPARTAGRQVYLLGIPFIDLTKSPTSTGFNQAVLEANAELAVVAGEHFIPSPPLASTDYAPDGLHLLTSGQVARATVVRVAISK